MNIEFVLVLPISVYFIILYYFRKTGREVLRFSQLSEILFISSHNRPGSSRK